MIKKEIHLSILFGTFFVFLIVLFAYGFSGNKVYAYNQTGHEDFTRIEFVSGEHRLLNDYTNAEINDLYRRVNRKAFGWVTHYLLMDEKVDYDGIVIFSRSNKTSKNMNFEYYLKNTTTVKTDVKMKGNVSAKVSGTIKKINTTLTGAIEGDYEKDSSTTDTVDSKTTINIVIYPKTKITMIQTGEAYITSGVSKHYFFGVSFRKGVWERIDVATMYYELREEVL